MSVSFTNRELHHVFTLISREMFSTSLLHLIHQQGHVLITNDKSSKFTVDESRSN